MRRFPIEQAPAPSDQEAPRRTRPVDKRRRFPDPTKRPGSEATPQENTNDGHDG